MSPTQVQRSASTQRRVLEAAVSALSELGYGGTTLQEVQNRAGVSRGAMLHHFATRAELLAAAVSYLERERTAQLLVLLRESAPTEPRAAWAIRTLWASFDGPLFIAALELWLAARYEPELPPVLIPQERVIGKTIRALAEELFGVELAGQPDFPTRLGLMLDAMRGAAARAVLRDAEADARLVATWTTLMTLPPDSFAHP